MKITKLEVIKVKPRWMFLKMHTDAGIVGLGEPVLEGHCNAVEAVLREFEEYLIGKDPMMIEHHVQALYRGGFYRGGPLMLSAISGIEQAMWDIKGKYYNCPVYEMLGGKCRDKIRMYTHIKRTAVVGEFSIEEMLDIAQQRMDEGYTALKYSINMSRIRGKNTKPEEIVRKYLFAQGFRYRKNDSRFPGKPDIVLPKYKTVIFVNGCFWHGHEGCRYFVWPRNNADFWKSKITGNVQRDSHNAQLLAEQGWNVITIWECELKRNLRETTLETLATQLKKHSK